MQLMGWVFTGANVSVECRETVNATAGFGPFRNVSDLAHCDDVFTNGSYCDSEFVYDTALIKDSVAMEFDLVSLSSCLF